MYHIYETRDGWAVAQSPDLVVRHPDRPGECRRLACTCRLTHPRPFWVSERPHGSYETEAEALRAANRIANSADFWGD